MASSIGVRLYRLEITRKGSSGRLPFGSPLMARRPIDFVKAFVSERRAPTQEKEAERSWYFEPKKINDTVIRGYLHYGTFGFESNLVDHNTKQSNYRRKVTDVEEIPLFFEFWFPPNANFGLIVFQSFQGRSCINLVMNAMKELFEQESRECYFRYLKIMPSDAQGNAFSRAPVKRIRLIRKLADKDIADKYMKLEPNDLINIEVALSARRNRSLGDLKSVMGKMPSDVSGTIEFDGVEFDEAVAEIKVGGRLRPVGVFGPNTDAGVIDITASIDRGPNGHPTFASLERETTSLLKHFYTALSGKQS